MNKLGRTFYGIYSIFEELVFRTIRFIKSNYKQGCETYDWVNDSKIVKKTLKEFEECKRKA